MNAEFQKCLRKRKIKKFSRGRALVKKELSTAERDLIDAQDSLKSDKFKWSTIQAYYSMFHNARALLYALNYREQSPYCLIVALRHLYVDKKLLPPTMVESLNRAKTLRENADYYDRWSNKAAESVLTSAEKFLAFARKLVL